MVSVEHSIKFVTEFDETHPISQRFLELGNSAQVEMLEGMLKALVLPAIYPVINEINEGGSYAILKVVE
jgi:hypothetical protein